MNHTQMDGSEYATTIVISCHLQVKLRRFIELLEAPIFQKPSSLVHHLATFVYPFQLDAPILFRHDRSAPRSHR